MLHSSSLHPSMLLSWCLQLLAFATYKLHSSVPLSLIQLLLQDGVDLRQRHWLFPSHACLFYLSICCSVHTSRERQPTNQTKNQAQVFSVRFVWTPRRTFPYVPDSKADWWFCSPGAVIASACCQFWALSRKTQWLICFISKQVLGVRNFL